MGPAGTSTLALGDGGDTGPAADVTITEQWKGTNWTEDNDLTNGRSAMGGAGTYPSALVFGGTPGDKANTEEWNGTNWSETTDLSTARRNLGGSGTQSLALAFGELKLRMT